MRTPWGESQESKKYARGIVFYYTASHGGFHLSHGMNAHVPSFMRNEDGWYEEDCEAVKVIISFDYLFGDAAFLEALATLKDYYPNAYESLTGKTLRPEESYVRREEEAKKNLANSWVVSSAWGSWNPKVPKGFVGVYATKGIERTGEAKYFLIPEEEYKIRGEHFVVDTSRHQEVEQIG